MGVDPEADAELAHRARLAPGAARRGRRARGPPPAGFAGGVPRARGGRESREGPRRPRESRRCRRGRRRMRPRPARQPASSTIRAKNAGSGFRTPSSPTRRSRRREGRPREPTVRARPSGSRRCPRSAPGRASPRGTGSRRGRGRRARRGSRPTSRRPLDAEMRPAPVVLLTARDRDSECRPHDVRLQPDRARPARATSAPRRSASRRRRRRPLSRPHDAMRLEPKGARRARPIQASRRSIFSRRGSPSTTLTGRRAPPRAMRSPSHQRLVAPVRRAEDVGDERLRRLHADERGAIDRLDDHDLARPA